MPRFAFPSGDATDLHFEAGEILRVWDWGQAEGDDGEWFEGENQLGKAGTFPSSYVREIVVKGPKAVGGMPS